MGDIGKEIQFCFMKLLLFFRIYLPNQKVLFQFVSTVEKSDNQKTGSSKKKKIAAISPPCPPWRWQHFNLQNRCLFVPYPVVVGSLYPKLVSARV
ncbi:hypothetical protein D3C73_584180 [compost metagenome]